jgi:hypothetical protein
MFPYETLTDTAPVEQRQEAWMYGQLAMAVAWQQGQLPLDNLL